MPIPIHPLDHNVLQVESLNSYVHLWIGKIKPNAETARCLRPIIDDHERARADRFKFPDLQHRFTQRRATMRRVLSSYLGVAPEQIPIATGPFGKPYLLPAWNSRQIHFSLTHSGDWMILAITQGREIGVDVEVVRQSIDYTGLAQAFFSADDCQYIHDTMYPMSPLERFFRVWTCKEAYIKSIGAGLSIPLDQFCVDVASEPARLKYARHQHGADTFVRGEDWQFDLLDVAPGVTGWNAVYGKPAKILAFSLDHFSVA